MEMPAFLFGKTSSGVAVVTFDREPLDDEWEAYIRFLLANETSLEAVVCFAHGMSGPPSKQRRVHNDRTAALWEHVPFAMVSDSRIMRGVMTAMAWILKGSRSQAFSPRDTRGAYRFLGLSADDVAEVEALRARHAAHATADSATA